MRSRLIDPSQYTPPNTPRFVDFAHTIALKLLRLEEWHVHDS
ncbi:MAG: hypothetical protein ACKVPZ_01955 [Burkholderiaceae bacterium]